MSRRQCCVWGCHNRKGRCAEDIDGNRLCECPTLQMEHCPKRDILSLYTIERMPQHVKQAVVQKINLTRQGPRGNKWRPTKDSVICNVHYSGFKGPTKDVKDVFPVNFKRPRHYSSTIPAPKRKKVTIPRKQKPVAKLSCPVNVVIPQAANGSSHNELHADCGEWQQSSAVESSTEPVAPGNVPVSRDDLVDIHSVQVQPTISLYDIHQGDLSGEQGDMEDSVSLDTDIIVATNEESNEDVGQVDARITKLQQENDELHHDNDELRQENDRLRQENDKLRQEIVELKQTMEDYNSNVQRLNLIILSDFQVQMYTGISRKTFECLVGWLEPVSRKKGGSDELSPSQKLLLVLMRLRHNFTQNDLACRFNIEQSSVSRLINNWVPLLSAQLKGLIKWPQTTIGPTDPPYHLLPNAVAIIDGTEIFIQRPSNLTTQKSVYSDYKSHTTVKFLVAIDTFTGVFIFVSHGFSGSSNDRFTIQHSGILDELKPGQ